MVELESRSIEMMAIKILKAKAEASGSTENSMLHFFEFAINQNGISKHASILPEIVLGHFWCLVSQMHIHCLMACSTSCLLACLLACF